MITIYQLISSIQLGGAENVAFQLTEHCKTNSYNNFKFTIVELYDTNNEYAKREKNILAEKNIKTLTLFKGSKRLSLLFAPIKLTYLIWKNKPNIVHSHTDIPDFVLANSIRLLSFLNIKKPAIARTIHNTKLWGSHSKFAKYTESAYYNDAVANVSKGAFEAHKQLRRINKLPVSPFQSIIYNGCKIPQKQEHSFKIDKNKINIAFCGRFEVYKGIDTLISVIRKVNDLLPQTFVFHIIGNGLYLNNILNLAKANENVIVYDSISNISDKFVLKNFSYDKMIDEYSKFYLGIYEEKQ